jgi:succinate dehydrogenase / fumarate reductase cytochrome b subunit
MATVTTSKKDFRTNYDRRTIGHVILRSLRSTVGSKYLVALTGLALTGFVIIHMAGNLLLFKGRDALNSYALALKDLGGLLWALRLGLLALFVLHIWLAIRLTARNRAARPVGYVYEDTVQATWASRTMIYSGLLILAFVVFHLLHYTFGLVVATAPDGTNFLDLSESLTETSPRDPGRRHDVYAMTVYGFRNVAVSVAYVVAQLVLGLHLYHGIASTFQSLGWNNTRWNPLLTAAGRAVAILIVAGNVSMPLAVMTGFVGGDVPGRPPVPVWAADAR